MIKEREIAMQEVDRGIKNRNEYRTEFELEEVNDEILDQYIPNRLPQQPQPES